MRWLTSLQLRSTDPRTRARAARRLGAARRPSTIADLTPLVADPEAAVRLAAIEALGAIGGEAVADPLIAAARGADAVRPESDAAEMRAAVVAALTSAGEAVVPALLTATGDRHARVRECAVAALAGIGGEQAAGGLARALGDDRSALRQLAAHALARVSGAGAVADLASALLHKDTATRRAAAEALGETTAEEAVPALQRALADTDRGVQTAAVGALARIGRGSATEALVGALVRPDRELRLAAAQALRSAGWVPEEPGPRTLHAALHGRFDEIGKDAAGDGVFGNATVEMLKVALSDKNPAARAGAAAALGRLGDEGAAPALGSLLGDPDPGTREAAVAALAQLGPAAFEAILPGLEDRSSTTRAAARRVLEALDPGRVADYLVSRLSPGQAVTHGGLPLRIVDRLEALDAARHAADSLERLLRLAGHQLPPASVERAAALPDLVLIEPGQVPDAGERLDLEDLRELAARTLSGTGPNPLRGTRR